MGREKKQRRDYIEMKEIVYFRQRRNSMLLIVYLSEVNSKCI